MTQNNSKQYVVRVSENALISIFLSSLEAYSVKAKNITGKGKPAARIEICGSLFGHEIVMKNKDTIYQIEIAHVDTTAEQRRSSVNANEEAVSLKADMITSFWPHLSYLGDFHSHPYKDKKEVLDNEGYYMSKEDRDWLNEDFPEKLQYRAALVMTIAAMKRGVTRRADWIDSNSNCVQATLGNYRIWLAAYCAYAEKDKYRYTEDNDMRVTLDCPALTGLAWEHTPVGKYKDGKHWVSKA